MNTMQVEPTADGITKFLLHRTNESWEKNKQPYMLSDVAPELKKFDVNYKDVLGPGMTLKGFASTLADKIKIVVHPIHKSKIGLVPATSDFVFHAEPTVGSI